VAPAADVHPQAPAWRVLGIESSCDDTAAAVFDSREGLLAHRRYSQVALHADYGGVVPELAARDHIRKLLPLVRAVLEAAATPAAGLSAVAYTQGPGLAGALLVGASVACGLARSLGIPALGVHHMEGHLLAPQLEPDPPPMPFIALLVSGGHTLLADVQGLGRYRVIGESVDDAAGEAFDKIAMLLGLGYPGGPAIAVAAAGGDPGRFRFTRPMTNRPGLDFSFSGLKTQVGNTIRAHGEEPGATADIACGFQEAVVDTLVIKCRRAVRATGLRRVVVAGGVGANTRLRERLREAGEREGFSVYYPRPEFCTDNAAMIALAGCLRLQAGERGDYAFDVRARWDIDSLAPPGAAA